MVADALKALEWAGVLTWQNRITRILVRERDLFGQSVVPSVTAALIPRASAECAPQRHTAADCRGGGGVSRAGTGMAVAGRGEAD
jgi:hypothetical protein